MAPWTRGSARSAGTCRRRRPRPRRAATRARARASDAAHRGRRGHPGGGVVMRRPMRAGVRADGERRSSSDDRVAIVLAEISTRLLRAARSRTTRCAPSTSASWSRRWSASPPASRWRGSTRSRTRSRRSWRSARRSSSSSTSATRGSAARSSGPAPPTTTPPRAATHYSPGERRAVRDPAHADARRRGTAEVDALLRATYADGRADVSAHAASPRTTAAASRARPDRRRPARRAGDGARRRPDARPA